MPTPPHRADHPRPAAPAHRRQSRRWTPVPRLAVVVLVAAAGLAACRSDKAVPAAASIAHVHGLGINPADGTLYVATHTGTFRVPDDGPVQRVGRSAQDTMGFTVVGPDHFLGSGHPDAAGFRQGKPARLGLIESRDAGASWTSRSLSGEADFHALAASRGTTYGWEAGTNRLLASTDGLSWETRSTLQLSALAVDPARPERLVAAGADATLVSSDGGRTWQPIIDAPQLAALSWTPAGTLWGVDATGGAHSSTDGGTTWEAAGRVEGRPVALAATDDRLAVAVSGQDDRTAIYESRDQGRTWQLRYRAEG